MRSTFLTGFRLTSVYRNDVWKIIYAIEMNYTYSAPTVRGTWKFTETDSSKNIISESIQSNTGESVPLFNSVMGLGMIGLRRQISPNFVVEGAIGGGLGGATVKYAVNFPTGSGTGGFTGIAAEGMARLGLKIFLSDSLAFGLEARSLILPVSDNWFVLLGGRSSNYNRYAGMYAHLFLFSVTYRPMTGDRENRL